MSVSNAAQIAARWRSLALSSSLCAWAAGERIAASAAVIEPAPTADAAGGADGAGGAGGTAGGGSWQNQVAGSEARKSERQDAELIFTQARDRILLLLGGPADLRSSMIDLAN